MTSSTMYIVCWNSSVDENLIKQKGITSFSNYDDMKKYMDELIWEMRISDMEVDERKQYIISTIKSNFDNNKKIGFCHFVRTFMEQYSTPSNNTEKKYLDFMFIHDYTKDITDFQVITSKTI